MRFNLVTSSFVFPHEGYFLRKIATLFTWDQLLGFCTSCTVSSCISGKIFFEGITSITNLVFIYIFLFWVWDFDTVVPTTYPYSTIATDSWFSSCVCEGLFICIASLTGAVTEGVSNLSLVPFVTLTHQN